MDCQDRPGLLTNLIAEASFKHIPASLFAELTRRCNLRCHHCFLNDHDGGQELSTREWLGVLDEIAGMGGFVFTISGGEPLLRDDLEEIAAHAVELGYFTRLFTNGTLIDARRMEKLEKVHWQAIDVSLHGATAQSHEALTGMAGSFAQTLAAMRLIKDAGINLGMKTNITHLNMHEIEAMIELARDLGANKYFSPMLTAKEDGDTAPLCYQLDDEQLVDALTTLKLAADRAEMTEPELFKGEESPAGTAIACTAGRGSCEIHANGDVTPCTDLLVTLGNIRLQNFRDIWYNNPRVERLLQLGEQKIPECLKCEYSIYCVRCPGSALGESGSMSLPLVISCSVARAQWKAENRLWQKKNT
jgi:radical SAM protein with 4Fe4S-binding SPASM domain